MKAKELFELYKEELSKVPDVESMFTNSGILNRHSLLEFGFFPLGSGIFKERASKIDEAEIDCKIMVLGNDFGTQEYVATNCPGNREKPSNPTIRNLLKELELNVENTFFTNLFLGLRNGGTNTKRETSLKEDYKQFCINFFKIQLDVGNPTTVLCLGKDVAKTLSRFPEFSSFKTNIAKLFQDETSTNYIVYTNDEFFGKRKFVLIPHPSFAHINWQKNDIKKKIREAILI